MASKDFEFNGVSLISPRWNIQYIPEGIPKKRGNNVQVPYADGETWVKKSYESRTDVLNMWIKPVDATGVLPVGKAPKEQAEINVEYLKSLFGIPGLVVVRKKMADGTWRKGHAEIVNAIEFAKKVDRANYLIFSVELHFPDPFWYSETLTTVEIAPTSAAYTFSVTNAGTAPIKKMDIIYSTGGFSSPKLENLSTSAWMKIDETISSGTELTVDTEACTVLDDDSANHFSALKHSGDTNWMTLLSGLNNMKLSCGSTPGGTVTIKYYPAYF